MEASPVRVLLIEDSPGDARLIREMLTEVQAVPFAVEQADRLSAGMERLAAGGTDAVLLDLGLPDCQGLETFLRAHEAQPGLPIIVLSGLSDEAVAYRAVHEGAQDYLVKGQIDGTLLARAVRYAIERKRSEQALRESERDLRRANEMLQRRTGELEAFSYTVSHDLKEPLRTLENFSRFLLDDYQDGLDEQGRSYLVRMGNASARLKQMIEDLLILSRVGRAPETLARIDVDGVLADVATSFQAALRERRARLIVEPALPAVAGERLCIEQVFGNLIANALKFNAGEPVIHIGLREMRDGFASLFVEDNGIGIDEEHHERIFGIFQRLHRREEYEGTGAGLAIVKRAAETLGGGVALESTPGAGATFIVTLPVWQGTASSGRAA
jgi:two-component system sensor histidine kinase/response regulator